MWAIYAALSALFVATIDPIAKRVLQSTRDEYATGWFSVACSLPFLAAYYFSDTRSPFTPELLRILIIIMPFEVLAVILYYRALKLTDISLSVPFLALTPVFAIMTAFLLLGERVRPSAALGIMLIAIGAYSLNLKTARYGFTNPVRAVFLNKGSLCMVGVALIFSFTATMAKKAMLVSSPRSIPLIYNASLSIALFPVLIYRWISRKPVCVQARKMLFAYLALGLCLALANIFFFKAVSVGDVACSVAIKRVSLVISVIYGWIFFGERDIRLHLAAAVCMAAGIALVLI